MRTIPLRPVAGANLEVTLPARGAEREALARTPWRWSRLLWAPHRIAFFAGAVMVALAALWWGAMLLLRAWGVAVPWTVSSGLAHGSVMGFGFMPFFIAGFLFTAGPRWLAVRDVRPRYLLTPLVVMFVGWIGALLGFHLSLVGAAVSLALVAAGWAMLATHFGLLVLQSRARDRQHAGLLTAAAFLGAFALWGEAVSLVMHREDWARAALHAALWGFPALTFAVAAHRMIPIFTAAVLPAHAAWRPKALLGLFVLAIVLQMPLAAADALMWPWSPTALTLRAVVEAVAGGFLLWLAVRWGLVQSLRVRPLAMLHLGFFWFGVAFSLAALSHALSASTDGAVTLGLAPLHALTMGYLASMLLAMATRVACGHSGRALAVDNWAWVLFWALQAAAVLRVAADLWPALGTALTLLAAQAWVAAVVAWAVRYGRWFGQPRVDGRPG